MANKFDVIARQQSDIVKIIKLTCCAHQIYRINVPIGCESATGLITHTIE